jgi:hypothetical protein
MSCMFVQLSCVDCNGQFHAACLQTDVKVTGEASEFSRVMNILSSGTLSNCGLEWYQKIVGRRRMSTIRCRPGCTDQILSFVKYLRLILPYIDVQETSIAAKNVSRMNSLAKSASDS